MDKRIKKLAKRVKKIGNGINSERGLMFRENIDYTASVYRHGKENKPYLTINAKCDHKISVLKLAVIFLCVAVGMAIVISFFKRLAEKVKCRARKSKKPSYYDEDALA